MTGIHTNSFLWTRVLLLVVTVSLGSYAMAGTVKWEELSRQEQTVLQAFQSEWAGLPDNKQKALRRWAAKPADERARIKQRYQEWKQLDAQQQQNISKALKRYRVLSAEQKAKLKTWYKWVQQLPADERRALKAKWAQMNAAERKAYMQTLQEKYGKH